MDFNFTRYITNTQKIINSGKTLEERQKLKAAIDVINCVARYRGWSDSEHKSKVLEALTNDKLFFSTALGYNDPYDTLIYIDWDRLSSDIKFDLDHFSDYVSTLDTSKNPVNQFAKYLSGAPFIQETMRHNFLDLIHREVDDITKGIHDNIKGICFSLNPNSILMWSHYAHNHEGISLLYDKEELKKADVYDCNGNKLNHRFLLEEIIYSDRRVDGTAAVSNYILHKHQQYIPIKAFGKIFPFPYSDFKKIILTKNSEWSYEKEVRLIPQKLDFETSNPCSYIKIRPKAIIMGAKISSDDKADIRAIAKKLKITLYQAHLSGIHEYKMYFDCDDCKHY